MNRADISRDKIIDICVEELRNSGDSDLNIRTVARCCGVAVGSIYNYFPTKAELVIAVIGRVWSAAFRNVFLQSQSNVRFTDFVSQMYTHAYEAQKDYHHFFLMHRSLMGTGENSQAKNAMGDYLNQIRSALLKSLGQDPDVDPVIWNDSFTMERLTQFVFLNLLSSLSRDEPDCAFLLVVLERLLYRQNA